MITFAGAETGKSSPCVKICVAPQTDFVFVLSSEPDLFLYAAEKMGEQPQNCVVIEDSLAGLQAAVAASMTPVAFVGSDMTQTPEFQENLKKLNIKNVFQTMDDVFAFLQSHY